MSTAIGSYDVSKSTGGCLTPEISQKTAEDIQKGVEKIKEVKDTFVNSKKKTDNSKGAKIGAGIGFLYGSLASLLMSKLGKSIYTDYYNSEHLKDILRATGAKIPFDINMLANAKFIYGNKVAAGIVAGSIALTTLTGAIIGKLVSNAKKSTEEPKLYNDL